MTHPFKEIIKITDLSQGDLALNERLIKLSTNPIKIVEKIPFSLPWEKKAINTYLITLNKTIEHHIRYTINDNANNQSLNLKIDYKLQAQEDKLDNMVLRLYDYNRQNTLEKNLDDQIRHWINREIIDLKSKNIPVISSFLKKQTNGLTISQSIELRLKERMGQKLGLDADITVSLADTDKLVPIEFTDLHLVRTQDANKWYDLKSVAKLRVIDNQRINAILTDLDTDGLKETIKKTISNFIGNHSTLHQIYYHIDEELTSQLIPLINTNIQPYFRELSSLNLSLLYVTVPDQTIFLNAMHSYELHQLHKKIDISSQINLHIDDIGKYLNNEIIDREEWVQQKLNNIINDVFSESTNIVQIQEILSNEYSEVLQNRVQEYLNNEARQIGCSVRYNYSLSSVAIYNDEEGKFPIAFNKKYQLLTIDKYITVKTSILLSPIPLEIYRNSLDQWITDKLDNLCKELFITDLDEERMEFFLTTQDASYQNTINTYVEEWTSNQEYVAEITTQIDVHPSEETISPVIENDYETIVTPPNVISEKTEIPKIISINSEVIKIEKFNTSIDVNISMMPQVDGASNSMNNNEFATALLKEKLDHLCNTLFAFNIDEKEVLQLLTGTDKEYYPEIIGDYLHKWLGELGYQVQAEISIFHDFTMPENIPLFSLPITIDIPKYQTAVLFENKMALSVADVQKCLTQDIDTLEVWLKKELTNIIKYIFSLHFSDHEIVAFLSQQDTTKCKELLSAKVYEIAESIGYTIEYDVDFLSDFTMPAAIPLYMTVSPIEILDHNCKGQVKSHIQLELEDLNMYLSSKIENPKTYINQELEKIINTIFYTDLNTNTLIPLLLNQDFEIKRKITDLITQKASSIGYSLQYSNIIEHDYLQPKEVLHFSLSNKSTLKDYNIPFQIDSEIELKIQDINRIVESKILDIENWLAHKMNIFIENIFKFNKYSNHHLELIKDNNAQYFIDLIRDYLTEQVKQVGYSLECHINFQNLSIVPTSSMIIDISVPCHLRNTSTNVVINHRSLIQLIDEVLYIQSGITTLKDWLSEELQKIIHKHVSFLSYADLAVTFSRNDNDYKIAIFKEFNNSLQTIGYNITDIKYFVLDPNIPCLNWNTVLTIQFKEKYVTKLSGHFVDLDIIINGHIPTLEDIKVHLDPEFNIEVFIQQRVVATLTKMTRQMKYEDIFNGFYNNGHLSIEKKLIDIITQLLEEELGFKTSFISISPFDISLMKSFSTFLEEKKEFISTVPPTINSFSENITLNGKFKITKVENWALLQNKYATEKRLNNLLDHISQSLSDSISLVLQTIDLKILLSHQKNHILNIRTQIQEVALNDIKKEYGVIIEILYFSRSTILIEEIMKHKSKARFDVLREGIKRDIEKEYKEKWSRKQTKRFKIQEIENRRRFSDETSIDNIQLLNNEVNDIDDELERGLIDEAIFSTNGELHTH